LSLLLERRSLVITTSRLYTEHLHGIDDIAEDVLPVFPSHDHDQTGCPEEEGVFSELTTVAASSAHRDEREVEVDETGTRKAEIGHKHAQQRTIRLANETLLRDEMAKTFAMRGGVLPRDTRYSLTCRDVERVWKARVWMAGTAAAAIAPK
jgi:alkylated DNA repair protein alkB homolog 6